MPAAALPIALRSVPSHNSVRFEINNIERQARVRSAITFATMLDLYRIWFGAVFRMFRTRRSLMLENLALRQQLAVTSPTTTTLHTAHLAM
jgi:hypothetical protein